MPETTLTTWAEHDPMVLPQVEDALHPESAVVIGSFARVSNSGFEVYVPVADDEENNLPGGGFLQLSEAQARHIYNELAHLFMARADKDKEN